MPLTTLLWARIRRAAGTPGSRRDWAETLGLLAVVAIAAELTMPDFSLTEARPQLDFRHILAAIAAFFAPAILEELVFRVLPIPHRDEHAGRLQVWVWATVAVTVYVAWHPLNAWLFHVAARPVFYAPGFLATTTVLGACCAIAYRRSGSLWPPVAIHWAVVAAWLLFYDGAKVFWAA